MLLATFVAAALACPQGPTSTATIDDAQSHGTVGDSLLSLDEAIQLANGTLAVSSLSASEQARLQGTGAVTDIVIDAAITPIVSLQAPLTTLTGLVAATTPIQVSGFSAASALPVLIGGSQPTILSLGTRLAIVSRLRFEDGGVAIDAIMPAPANPVTEMAMATDCEFEGQTVAAVRLRGTGTDKTRLMIRNSSMQNMPVGFRLEDQTNNGQLMSENERITMDGVSIGCSVFEDGNGAASAWQLWRSTFVNGQTLAKTTRSPTATQLLQLRIVYSDATCTGDVIDMEGTAAGVSLIHHHHSDWVAGAGRKVLWTHPRTAQFDVHGSEMEFDGDILLAGGLTSPRFWHQNNHYKNGTITFDIDGALPNLVWNRYENCSIAVPSQARSPVIIRASQMVGTDIDSQSFLAPVNLQNCYRSGGTKTGFGSESNATTTPFLGTSEVTPRDPQVGTSVNLNADLPFGIGMIWDIALSFPRPVTSAEPIRFYGDPATVIVLPAIVIFQSTLTLPIPNSIGLIGQEFYAQGISLPLVSLPYAPDYHLPRGGLIYLRP